jgi:hypothetical protein
MKERECVREGEGMKERVRKRIIARVNEKEILLKYIVGDGF